MFRVWARNNLLIGSAWTCFTTVNSLKAAYDYAKAMQIALIHVGEQDAAIRALHLSAAQCRNWDLKPTTYTG